MFAFLLIPIFVGILGIFYFWAKWKHGYWRRRGVSTLPTSLIFGNFADSILLKISPGYLLGRLHNEAEADAPFVGVYIMHEPYLLLRSPELMRQIFVKDFNVFPDRYFGAPESTHDPVADLGLFAIKSPEWRYLRTKLSPAFTTGKLKQLFGVMLETAEFMSVYMDDFFKGSDELAVTMDLKDVAARFTTDVISSLAFGIRTNSFAEPAEFYEKSRVAYSTSVLETFQLFTVSFFPKLAKYLGGKRLGRHTDYFRDVFWSSMSSREACNREYGDVIDKLVRLKNEKSENGIEIQGDTLVAQSAIIFIAGLESSATTIAFALWELAKQPEIQDRVRRDIMEHLDESGVSTYESVQNMKYLLAAINETLRLYPQGSLIDRVASEDYKIPGTEVVLEKGTVVYAALPGIHMDPRYHPEPERYDPDRFSPERKNDIVPYTFMPFGEGPRNCIGLRVGMLQAAVGVLSILRNYEVSLNPNYENGVSKRWLFVAPEGGIILNVRKLQSS